MNGLYTVYMVLYIYIIYNLYVYSYNLYVYV